jgi:hypothetical protein
MWVPIAPYLTSVQHCGRVLKLSFHELYSFVKDQDLTLDQALRSNLTDLFYLLLSQQAYDQFTRHLAPHIHFPGSRLLDLHMEQCTLLLNQSLQDYLWPLKCSSSLQMVMETSCKWSTRYFSGCFWKTQHQRPLKKEEYGPIANDSTRKPLTTYFYNAILPKDVGNPSESLCQDIATKR